MRPPPPSDAPEWLASEAVGVVGTVWWPWASPNAAMLDPGVGPVSQVVYGAWARGRPADRDGGDIACLDPSLGSCTTSRRRSAHGTDTPCRKCRYPPRRRTSMPIWPARPPPPFLHPTTQARRVGMAYGRPTRVVTDVQETPEAASAMAAGHACTKVNATACMPSPHHHSWKACAVLESTDWPPLLGRVCPVTSRSS